MASFGESHFGIPSIFEGEKTTVPAPNIEGQDSASSSHKRTSAVWNNFERVMVDGVLKVKYKKYTKLYSCAGSVRIYHLKRHQESYMVSDTRLQNTLNI